MVRLFSILSILASLLFAFPRTSAGQEAWKSGAAKVIITPEKYMWMAGYAGRKTPADGKLTDLWAKALIIEDGQGHRAAMIALDLVGIDRTVSQSICAKLEKQYGFARHQIAICCSHTHSGPVVAKNLRAAHDALLDDEQKKLIDQYAATLEEKIVAVVGEALKKLAPSQIAWGSGKATFAVNRRTNKEAEVPKLREAGKTLAGPFDHDVPVLAVKDASGKLTSVMFGYACHATVLSLMQWCADYPGYAQIELEKSHPDCVALFWAGCGGDQNPLPRRTVELAQNYGRQLAKSVDEVLAQPMQPVRGTLHTSYQEVAVEFDKLPTRERLETLATGKDVYEVSRAKALLAQLDAGTPLSPTYPYPVGIWRIGNDVQWVVLGGEVVVDYAVRLKRELTGIKTWVAGYSNDVMAYIPSRRVLLEGGYEGAGAMVYYGLPTIWGPEVEETIVAEVHRQAK